MKRDLEQRGCNEVRIMTVHGAKGLQAPIVFLPDTLQVPNQLLPLLWTASWPPLWRAHKRCGAPAWETAKAEAKRQREAEYRRLLYVGADPGRGSPLCLRVGIPKQPPGAGCWYPSRRTRNSGAAAGAESVEIDLTAVARRRRLARARLAAGDDARTEA